MSMWRDRFSFDHAGQQIILHVGKVEIGQHVYEAFRKIAARVLGVHSQVITIAPISTDTSPNDGLTAGSLSIQVTGASVKSAAEDLRSALTAQACETLDCNEDQLRFDADTLSFSWGSTSCLIFDLLLTQPPGVQGFKKGHATLRSVADLVRGQAGFIQDMILPGMVYARALRGRIHGDLSKANIQIFKDGGFEAIVADSQSELERAWHQLGPDDETRDPSCDGPVEAWIKTRRAKTTQDGDTSAINGTVTLSATRPFLLHASVAPSCAVAQFSNGVLEVWTHSQGIFQLRDAIAKNLGMEPSQVVARHIPSAGCYGHNAADDAAMDAVLVALQLKGVAVQVSWSREDEFRNSPVGAAMQVEVEANLTDDGAIDSWRHTIWSTPHGQRPGGQGHINLLAAYERGSDEEPKIVEDLPIALGGGATRNATPPYKVNSAGLVTHIVQDLPIRTSSIRGLGAQMNTIAIEATIDRLAQDLSVDPLQFRINNVSDPRGKAVLEHLRDATAIDVENDEALGIAYSRYKGKAAYAAVAAKVSLGDTVQVSDVWAVVDAGRVIDKSGAMNQVEGGIIQAISWTLCEGVLLRDGRVDAADWGDYPTIGWADIPKIHARFIDPETSLPPLGVGECMVGPVSAAIVNAVARLTGQTITDLPLTRERLIASL